MIRTLVALLKNVQLESKMFGYSAAKYVKCFGDVLIVSKIKRAIIVCGDRFFSKNFRSPIKFSRPRTSESENETRPEDENDPVLLDRNFMQVGFGHQVFIIQPVIKWGSEKKRNTTPELQLLESVKLIKTLRNWKIVGETIIKLESFRKQYFLGKGNLEILKNVIEKNNNISAVFLSVNALTVVQRMNLQSVLNVPVFDRYTIVLHILREHAKTKEAKLQIKLAELPYMWNMLEGMNCNIGETIGITQIGGHGPKLLEYRKELFRVRKAKIENEVAHLREQRQELSQARKKTNIPVVAVIGYTNAGKTSLIKALTGKESLEPQDYLFATLDITCHIGKLPCGLNVFYLDTLGFISDLPTYLIESFIATLEDAIRADVIIHVRDVSHPDTVAQNFNVIEILNKLELSERSKQNIITVGNKIDILSEQDVSKYKDQNIILVSSTELTGTDYLKQEIEKKIIEISGRKEIIIRVATGGEEYNWLHCQSTVVQETPDLKNNQYMFVKVIILPSMLAKFRHKFIENYKKS